MSEIKIEGESFVIDGKPTRILSGAMHYFRVRPELWRDRLRKLRLMGLNAVETYVSWNLHEPAPGKFDFSGPLDICRFFEIAKEEGLHGILRPGPFICAEWEFGGLPWWLLKDPEIRLRCLHKSYAVPAKRFLKELCKRVKPVLSSNGGPIMMIQIENEYGSYGNDTAYLAWLRDSLKSFCGDDILFFTSDGPTDWLLLGGTLPDVLKTVNFGSKPKEHFEVLRRHQPGKPLMCTEFWNGWFDHWGEAHHVRDPKDAAATLDEILSEGASVNFYMFHGGSSYGFNSGANCQMQTDNIRPGVYQPTVGSYDYDSPLDEAGDPTPKYFAYREVIAKHFNLPAEELPAPAPKKAYGKVELSESADLLDSLAALSKPHRSQTPEPMEKFNQGYGFILYRTHVKGPLKETPLAIYGLADRAIVFVDGVRKGVLSRIGDDERKVLVDIPENGAQIDLLVENMGRVNYGVELVDRKGINGGVVLNRQQLLYDWEVFPLPLESLKKLKFSKRSKRSGKNAMAKPSFFRGSFNVEGAPVDSFLSMKGWGKGVCWLNGFNLGRHWKIGPQMTHFLPASLLKAGRNEIIVLELEEPQGTLELIDHPVLG